MRRSPFLLALLLVLSATPAGAGAPDVQQVMALGAACEDTARADSAFHALGQVIATTTDSFPIAYCHYLRFRAARTLGRLDAMQASADTAVLFAPDNPRPFLELARTFAARDVRLGVAEDYARRAVETAARGHDSHLSGWSLAVLGIVQVARHDEAHAVDALRRSLSFAYADSQKTFLLLGKVCSTLGQRGPALDAYLRGVAVYRGDSTRVREARPVLDSLYRAEHGSLEGLASLVRRAREASLRNVVFLSRRDGRRAPASRLLDLRDSTFRRLDCSGVLVLDVWGTWCQPCREALPKVQQLAEKCRGRSVRFRTVSVEGGDPARTRRQVLDYLASERITLPVSGGDSAFVADFGIEVFPTTLVIRNGLILYRNEGHDGEILEQQIASLAGPAPARAAPSSAARRAPARGR